MARVVVSIVLSLPLVGAYALFAIGIVLIYRASRMLNLAHGAMAMLPAYLLYELVRAGVPMPLGVVLALASGAGFGIGVERIFVRRLRADGPTAQTVGTVAALGIIVAAAARLWGTASLDAVRVFPQGRVSVGQSSIQVGEIGLFVVMLAVAGALYVVIQRTDLGLMMRGTAESRLAASLMGVNPDRITSLTWALGGTLAALAGVLLAAVTALHPYNLALQAVPAFIAALLGGLGSLPGAVVGSAVVGVVQSLVPVLGSFGKWQGAPQLLLAALAIVVMATRGKTLVAGDDSGSEGRAIGGARAGSAEGGGPGRRRRRRPPVLVLVALAMCFPFVVPSSVVGAANLAVTYGVVAVALVLLTGWVGQISLGHAALVGVGAYATGHVVERLGIPFPLSIPFAGAAAGLAAAVLGAVALRVRGLYLAVATLVFSWTASEFLFRQRWFVQYDQIGDRPIGVRGTLPFFDFTDRRVFFVVAVAVLGGVVFAAANLRDSKTGRAFFALRGSEMAAASLGIDVMRYKLVAFTASGVIAGVAGNLIMSDARVVTAEQFTFNVSLFFVAIGIVGGLTSLGGAVASGVLFAALAEVFYRVEVLGAFLEIVSSVLLAVVLIAYPGGLASLPARLSALAEGQRRRLMPLAHKLRGRLAATAPRRAPKGHWRSRQEHRRPAPAKPPASSRESVGARVAPVLDTGRRLVARWSAAVPALRARAGHQEQSSPSGPLDFEAALVEAVRGSSNGHAPEVPSTPGPGVSAAELADARARIAARGAHGDRSERRVLVEAEHVTVRFGGLTAVNDASLQVREGEIVGLIGPNGAGKTTLFNSIAGYNTPTAGRILLYGEDVTGFPVHRRARVGVARTFQLIQLFRQLTVYENLLVATHVHNPTGLASHVLVNRPALESEAAARNRVQQILRLLDLEDLAGRSTGDLPFGMLRMVEVARALVTGFGVIMLDEPASGLDNAETDKLIEVLRFVRGLGVTLLLIEHDVRMVTGVSDYIYVLEQGRMIAEGPPEDIQRNPAVIAAYLGEPAAAERVEEPVG
jgi:ABC-type branched-subunit amino acid transport system ATPase component/ABC-type branched-subunit amino acid transport system permease subunit